MTARDQQIAAAVIEAAAKACDARADEHGVFCNILSTEEALACATAIRALDLDAILASAPKQEAEPDGWLILWKNGYRKVVDPDYSIHQFKALGYQVKPLYAAPDSEGAAIKKQCAESAYSFDSATERKS